MENPATGKPKKVRKGKKDKATGENGDNPEEGARKQFTVKDYSLICAWLEQDGNLEAVEGSKGKTKVGAKFPTKRRAFESMAAYINDHQYKGSTLATLDWEGVRNRFLLLQKKYKETKPIVNSTGWGLTAADQANGITSIEAKLDSMCPCFTRLDKIYGTDPNVNFAENNYSSPISLADPDVMPWSSSFTGLLNIDDDDTDGNFDGDDPQIDVVHDSAAEHVPLSPLPGEGITEVPPVLEDEEAPMNLDEEPAVNMGPTSGLTSPLEASTATNTAGSTHTGSASKNAKDKSERSSALPNKKRHVEKGSSITSAFTAGLEAIAGNKAKSNMIKEKSQELHFASAAADRALWAETTQKQIDFQFAYSQKKFDIQLEKLRVQERRIEAKEKKIRANKKRDLLQAQLALMTSTAHGSRSPTELMELFRMLSNPQHNQVPQNPDNSQDSELH